MPSPVSSKESQSYTPAFPEEDSLCKAEPPSVPSQAADAAALCTADPVSRQANPVCVDDGTKKAPEPRREADYFTVSAGAGAIIGADVSLTLDRNGHLYFGLGAGVGLSATIGSVAAQAGQLQGSSTTPPAEEKLDRFLKGDSIQLSASVLAQAGVANSPGGTAVEMGVGLVQASGEFQHNWYVLDLPIKW